MNTAIELALRGLVSMFGADKMWEAFLKIVERRTEIKLDKREETEGLRKIRIATKTLKAALAFDKQERENKRKVKKRDKRAKKKDE